MHNFAVIEGCDGSGTTTALGEVKKRFAARRPGGGAPLLAGSEPTGGPVGLLIRRILRKEISMEKETLARLFAADRGEHLYAPGGVAEHCRRGGLAVSDRYTPSSLVYQGLECGRALPEELNRSFPQPELLVYLDVDPGTAMDRVGGRGDRELYETLEFQARVRDAYLELLPRLEKEGVRVLFLDGTRPREEVAEAVWEALIKMPALAEETRGSWENADTVGDEPKE